jgi:murein DD-endopeptidase MepM/ murein hydrolase activator NlpD
MTRIRRATLAGAVAIATLLGLPATSRAQVSIPPIGSKPTPTPTPAQTQPPAPPPTTQPTPPAPPPTQQPTPKPTQGGGGSGGTTQPKKPPSGSGGSGSGGSAPRPAPRHTAPPPGSLSGAQSHSGTGGAPAASAPGATPTMSSAEVAAAIQLWLTRPKSPAHTSTRLLQLIADEVGGTPSLAQLRAGFGRFPVVGYVWYQDDFGAPRYNPYYQPHEGNDIFAEIGTPIVAASDGFIWKFRETLIGGNAIWLADGHGGYYYYGHLSAFAKGLHVGQRVRVGDVIGYVGATGSAKGTSPHLHFEIHPTGDPEGAVNPKPIIDSWLLQDEQRALAALGYLPASDATSPLAAARWPQLFEEFAQPAAPPPALWTAGFGSGGTIAAADLALSDLLAGEDLASLAPPPTAGGSADTSATGGDALSLFLATFTPHE